jgi:flagellar basal-body rod protein FlgC
VYDAIGTAGTGLQTYHTWLDVIANNIANVNDTAAPSGKVFQEHFLQASEIEGNGPIGQGVTASAVVEKTGNNGELVQDPANPLADGNGFVRRTDVDLSEQMGDLIAAQRAFQANADVVDRAKDVYEAAIGIGKGI